MEEPVEDQTKRSNDDEELKQDNEETKEEPQEQSRHPTARERFKRILKRVGAPFYAFVAAQLLAVSQKLSDWTDRQD
jgi:hypothetical protein